MPFFRGMLAGYGIAIPVGAIAILIVDTALRRGWWPGFAAGAGAASADFLYALLAAAAGQALSGLIAPLAGPLRAISGGVLLALGGYGIWRVWQTARSAPSDPAAAPAPPTQGEWRTYQQFLGLTLLNPLTIAYFAALILGGGGRVDSLPDRLLFVTGAGLASLSWQSLLAVFGALARRGLPPNLRWVLSLIGNLIIIGFGVSILVRLAMGW